jgi:phosphopantetheinyl transferase
MWERYGERLCLADIAVAAGEAGRPELGGAWAARLARPLAVSLAHSDGVAVALVGEGRGVGVDLEPLRRTEQAFEEVAFTAGERALLSSLAQSEGGDWPLRLWCAKEALGKALGCGLAAGPQAIVTQNVDVRSGVVTLRLAGELASRFPQLAAPLTAYTAREGEFLVASVLEV